MATLDLSNETFKIGANNFRPFTSLMWHHQSILQRNSSGLEFYIIQEMSKYFNFTYQLVNGNQIYDFKLRDGTHTGLMGDLIYGKIDLAIGGITLTYQRSQVTSYLYPHYFDQFTYSTSAPEISRAITQFIKPFDNAVWLWLILSVLLLFLFSVMNNLVIQYHHPRQSERRKREHILLVILRVLTRQSNNDLNQLNLSMKLCLAIWLITAVVVTNIYGGGLFSSIAIPDRKSINTVDELLRAVQSKSIKLIGNNFTKELLKFSKLPTLMALSDATEIYSNRIKSLNRLASPEFGPLAILGSSSRLVYDQSVYGKDSIFIPSLNSESVFFSTLKVILARPFFPYQNAFNQFLFRLTSSGLIERRALYENNLAREFSARKPSVIEHFKQLNLQNPDENFEDLLDDAYDVDEDSNEDHFDVLTMQNFAHMFQLYFRFMTLALLIFMVEILYSKYY